MKAEGNMAKQDFLDNFRIARNLFFHPHVETDSPSLDQETMQRIIGRAAIWLTPRSVKGFNAADFPELGLDRQRELQDSVQAFLAIATKVPPKEAATKEQLGNAQVAFQKILEILQPYLPTPQEGGKVEDALKAIAFPSWVVNWDYELGSDSDGIPSVWVNIFADENRVPLNQLGRFASELTTKVRQALTASGISRWPYVRLRTAAEHKAAV